MELVDLAGVLKGAHDGVNPAPAQIRRAEDTDVRDGLGEGAGAEPALRTGTFLTGAWHGFSTPCEGRRQDGAAR